MFEIIPRNLNIDFVGKRKILLSVSVLLTLATFVLMGTKGLNYGIDFTGGAEVQFKFAKSFSISELRNTMEEAGYENLVVQQLGEPADNMFLAKFRGTESQLQGTAQRVEATMMQKMARSDFEIQRVDVVGPQAGSELRKSGFLSIFYALLCILIYVAIRFDYRYSPGAVLGLFHDAVMTIGVFIVLQKEFSLQIIAAILTVIGYSNNDTIIVFDRIRETMALHPNRGIEENVNRSINETLSRTLLTSLSTLFVVVALMVFGGSVLHDFAFTMFIGIIVGTYSSIFISSSCLILMTQWLERKKQKAAKA